MDRPGRAPDQGSTRRANRIVTGTGDPSAASVVPREGTTGTSDASASEQGAGDRVKEKAEEAVGQVQQQAKPRLEGQKDRAAEQMNGLAQALRQTGQQLQAQDQGTMGQYVNRGAEQIERMSGYLRQHDVDDLIHDAERFAQRQPALFLGGALALGLLGARFVKSSRQRRALRQR